LSVDVVLQKATYEEVESEERGFKLTWRGVKFTATATELLLAGEQITPTKGDTIVSQDGIVFTVLPPKDKPAYEQIGDGYELTIYAKQTGTE